MATMGWPSWREVMSKIYRSRPDLGDFQREKPAMEGDAAGEAVAGDGVAHLWGEGPSPMTWNCQGKILDRGERLEWRGGIFLDAEAAGHDDAAGVFDGEIRDGRRAPCHLGMTMGSTA